ncbi:MAG: GAF domain-containing protein [Alphaproteobacteria bacterium]|nr:GAF domain-containing protein [Alphaproteobacteria bacterium]
MSEMRRFSMELAAAGNQPESAFRAMAHLTDALVGVRLFTLMTFDPQTREASRIFSNMPDVYPVLGTKPVNETHWTGHVLDRHETFVANTIEGIAEVFFDHELIRSLGCESVINVPVVVAGKILGTINCLHEAGHYTPERVAASEDLKVPGAACFMLNAKDHQGDQ